LWPTSSARGSSLLKINTIPVNIHSKCRGQLKPKIFITIFKMFIGANLKNVKN